MEEGKQERCVDDDDPRCSHDPAAAAEEHIDRGGGCVPPLLRSDAIPSTHACLQVTM